MRMGTIALAGILALGPVLAPAAQAADTPAFVNATLCDVAAPLAAGATVFRRQIRAERPLRAPGRAPSGKRAEARTRQAPAARPALVEPVTEPADETEAVLRPAVHFCVTPGGSANPVRYT